MSGDGAAFAGGIPDEHEEHENHEAWVIPYADMVTLLMALFLMLYAISTLDLAKFEKLAGNIRSDLGGESIAVDGGEGVLDGGAAPAPEALRTEALREAEAALERERAQEAARAQEASALADIERTIAERLASVGLGHSVGFRREARGLVVTIVTDNVLFEPGRAALRPEGFVVLGEVAGALAAMPNDIVVEGHTDDRPISTDRFPSNWELSTARATSVLRHLVDVLGLDPARVAAAGYGEQRPIAANDTPAGRIANRRVEVAVLAEHAA